MTELEPPLVAPGSGSRPRRAPDRRQPTGGGPARAGGHGVRRRRPDPRAHRRHRRRPDDRARGVRGARGAGRRHPADRRSRSTPHPAAIGAMLMTRLDELLVDLDPSAVMVYGGGMTAAIAAQVAFWRQIPVVHLQAGVASDDLLCPFPQEANRRVIGQLASLFLTTGGAAMGSPIGPERDPGRRHHGGQPAAVRPALRPAAAPGPGRRPAARAGRAGPARLAGRARRAARPARPASRTSRSSATGSWPRTAPPTRCSSTTGPPSSAACRSTSCSGWSRRAPCWCPTIPGWSPTRPGSARRRCWSTARTSRSRATRSAASSARP